jgi:hypothetical protein
LNREHTNHVTFTIHMMVHGSSGLKQPVYKIRAKYTHTHTPPVVPLVYMMVQRSPGSGSTIMGGKSLSPSPWGTSCVYWEEEQRSQCTLFKDLKGNKYRTLWCLLVSST